MSDYERDNLTSPETLRQIQKSGKVEPSWLAGDFKITPKTDALNSSRAEGDERRYESYKPLVEKGIAEEVVSEDGKTKSIVDKKDGTVYYTTSI